jgi:uncharacterized OB-fold protein
MDYAFEKVKIVGGIGADDEFWRSLERGEFQLPACSGGGHWTWPAHFRCGECGSWDFDWKALAPKGRIYAWTRSFYAFDRVAERRENVPYVTALVEIEGAGGARVLGMFEDDESKLAIDAEVIGEIRPPSEKSKGYPSIVWHLAA